MSFLGPFILALSSLFVLMILSSPVSTWPQYGYDNGRTFSSRTSNSRIIADSKPALSILAEIQLQSGAGGPSAGVTPVGNDMWLVVGRALSGVSFNGKNLSLVWQANSTASGGIGFDDTPTLLDNGKTALVVDCWRGFNDPSGNCTIRAFDIRSGKELRSRITYPNNETVIGKYVMQSNKNSDEIFYLKGAWNPFETTSSPVHGLGNVPAKQVLLACGSVSTLTEKWSIPIGQGSLKSSLVGSYPIYVSQNSAGIIFVTTPYVGTGIVAVDPTKRIIIANFSNPYDKEGIIYNVPAVGPQSGQLYVTIGSSFFNRDACFVYALSPKDLSVVWKMDTFNLCAGALFVGIVNGREQLFVRGYGNGTSSGFWGVLDSKGTNLWNGPQNLSGQSLQPFSNEQVMPVLTAEGFVVQYTCCYFANIFDGSDGSLLSTISIVPPNQTYGGNVDGSFAVGPKNIVGFTDVEGYLKLLSLNP